MRNRLEFDSLISMLFSLFEFIGLVQLVCCRRAHATSNLIFLRKHEASAHQRRL